MATEYLETFGLGHRLNHRPSHLSGGEQQRVAIARAIVNRPAILLADEPTGDLDVNTSEKVFKKLITLARDSGLSALIATHNMDMAAEMDRMVRLEDGVLKES